VGGTFLIFSMKDSKCEVASHGSILPRPAARRNIKSCIQELFPQKFQPKEMCFFLTSPFIELARYSSPCPL